MSPLNSFRMEVGIKESLTRSILNMPPKREDKKPSAKGRKKVTAPVLVVNRRKQRKPKGAVPTAKGSGAYRISGGVSWGQPDSYFRGNLGGVLTDGALSGSGAYSNIGRRVKKNSLQKAVTISGEVPQIANIGKGEATVIRHREFVKNIKSGDFVPGTTSSKFTLETIRINPANMLLNPWLSEIATNYQEYRYTGMIVELKTLSSELSTTLTLGAVFMATDYNVYALDPPDKVHLENMEYSTSCKPSLTSIMPIECERAFDANTHLYISPDSTQVAGADSRLYDLGKIHIGSEGIPVANAELAELWISYEVQLYKPRLTDSIYRNGECPGFFRNSSDYTQGGYPLGQTNNSTDIEPFNTNLISIDYGTPSTPSTINFVNNLTPTCWLVLLEWIGGAAALTSPLTPTFSVTNGIIGDTNWAGGFLYAPQQSTAGTTITRVIASQLVKTSGGSFPTIVTVNKDGVLPASLTNVSLMITCVPTSLFDAMNSDGLSKLVEKRELESLKTQLEELRKMVTHMRSDKTSPSDPSGEKSVFFSERPAEKPAPGRFPRLIKVKSPNVSGETSEMTYVISTDSASEQDQLSKDEHDDTYGHDDCWYDTCSRPCFKCNKR